MVNFQIFSKFGLIGENLDLKENVSLEIDKEGRILNIDFESPGKILDITPENNNNLMIPGFINSHIHIADNFAKEMGFNKELREIVAPPFGLKHKILRETPEDIIIEGIQKAVLEMLSNGIVHFIDFREGGVDGVNLLKKALKQYPINYLILGRFEDESEIESIFNLADGVGLPSYDKITTANKKWVVDSKQKFKKIIACHCAENSRNINLIKNMFNDNLVDVIIHGTKLLKEDLEKIKKQKKKLILCPRCNGYFGSGFPPIPEILKMGIPISLGTDNLMVNNAELFEELRYLYRISRVLCSYDKNIQLTSKELLKMVTINAAKNFNLENTFGSISEGKSADLFMIDLNAPNFYSFNLESDNIFNLITQRTKSENIKKVFIKGKLIFKRN
ncbi:MAG: amidohydrolase family protein [Promethearchaeota archaeon]